MDNTPISVEDIRVPEEQLYLEKIKSDPGVEKLLKKAPEIIQPQVRWQSLLNKEAVKITSHTRPDIIDSIEQTFRLFAKESPPYEVFGIKNFGREEWGIFMDQENAFVFRDNAILFVIFVHNILKTMTDREIKFIVGHEIGHYLLGHVDARSEFAALQWAIENIEESNETQFHELARFYYLWSQLQELSADRVGLIVSRDLEATISGLAKTVGGLISDKISTQDFISQAESTPLEEDEDWRQTHPYPPHRGWALSEFYESDLFRKLTGRQGGKPLAEFSRLLPRIVPLNEKTAVLNMPAPTGERETIEDLLIEVSLYNAISLADDKFTPAEGRTMLKFIPKNMRKELVQRWNQSVKDAEAKTAEECEAIFDSTLKKASLKDHRWKTRVVKNMIKIVRSDRRIREDELMALANYAAWIDARDECRRQFLKQFGYDPYSKTQ